MNGFDEGQKIAVIVAIVLYLIGTFLIEKFEPRLGARKKYADIALLVLLMVIVILGDIISGKT